VFIFIRYKILDKHKKKLVDMFFEVVFTMIQTWSLLIFVMFR